ncbi:hypothetical protein [Clostridium sp. E02]|uniref:hypothetical protein n=1 Tax=Clostridium sp. E02 TaxID=2487134 RepID=UPI000F5237DF|nr:hypothetical protein [Clostridium sp. E02]
MKAGYSGREKDKNIREGLLDRIAIESGCMYLSDLRGSVGKIGCRFAVSEIPATDYSEKIWQDAFYYITGIEENFNTAEQAKQRLLEYLKRGEK